MQPNTLIHAATTELAHQPVPADQTVSGAPSTGTRALVDFDGLELGIWEMTPGVMTDVEVEELFIVLSGSATVEFADGSPTLVLGPGDMARLAAGAQTTWTVTETLRKVYVA
ncbi:MAG: cupin domain-containing protein [Mycobacterium sp.]